MHKLKTFKGPQRKSSQEKKGGGEWRIRGFFAILPRGGFDGNLRSIKKTGPDSTMTIGDNLELETVPNTPDRQHLGAKKERKRGDFRALKETHQKG